jgi:hypothetical protein
LRCSWFLRLILDTPLFLSDCALTS